MTALRAPALGALTFRGSARPRPRGGPGRPESNRPKGAVPMPLSILVAVENRPELRDELADQLTADGHDVHQTHHSRHAVALLAGRHIDVLILGAREVRVAGAPVELSAMEFALLTTLASDPRRVFTKAPAVS